MEKIKEKEITLCEAVGQVAGHQGYTRWKERYQTKVEKQIQILYLSVQWNSTVSLI